jgi:L-malate glycosyltransferase
MMQPQTADVPASSAMTGVRILYLIDEMKALTDGGTERQVLQMIKLMTQRGACVQLCTLRGTDWLTSEIAGCPVRSWKIGSVLTPVGILRLLRFAFWIRRQRFDILQTFFVDANLVGPWLGKVAGVKAVLGSRRNLNYWMSSKQRVLQSLSNRLATRLVANCEAVRKSTSIIEKVPLAKIDVIYNGLDTKRFVLDAGQRAKVRKQHGYADDHIVIGMVAVLRPVKGCEVFVDAAALVSQKVPHARFILVGDGPLRDDFRERRRYPGNLERV